MWIKFDPFNLNPFDIELWWWLVFDPFESDEKDKKENNDNENNDEK